MSYPNTNAPTTKDWAILGGIVVFVLFILGTIFSSFTLIGAGERGVVTRLGAVQEEILDEGFNFKTPWIEDVVKMDVSVQKAEREADSASKDLQTITTTVAVNYHLNPLMVNDVYQNFKSSYEVNILEPAIQESVKAATSLFTAEELITDRPAVREQMLLAMRESVERYGVIIDGMSIVNFSFSPSFDTAVEAKVTAEQEALAAENKLKQVEFEAQQAVVSAQAEAESIRIQAEAITSQGGAEYVQLQWIDAWKSGGAQVPTMMLGEDTSIFLTP